MKKYGAESDGRSKPSVPCMIRYGNDDDNNYVLMRDRESQRSGERAQEIRTTAVLALCL